MKAARDFYTSKTTWAGVALICGAVASWLGGQQTFGEAEHQIAMAILGICVRDTIAKTAEAPSGAE